MGFNRCEYNSIQLVFVYFCFNYSFDYTLVITSSVCPDSNLLKPCSCGGDNINAYINCGGHEDIDLVKIFKTLDKQLPRTLEGRHFKSFYLYKSFITELKENTFSDITFDSIWIRDCSKLKTIHVNAFNTIDQVTTDIYIEHNPVLTSPDNSIFQVLSKFVRAEWIWLRYNNITEIPLNAFRNIVGKQE